MNTPEQLGARRDWLCRAPGCWVLLSAARGSGRETSQGPCWVAFLKPRACWFTEAAANVFFISSKEQANTKAPAANTSCAWEKTWAQTFPCVPSQLGATLTSQTRQPNVLSILFYCEPPKIWRFLKPRESCGYVKISSLSFFIKKNIFLSLWLR